ncbi:hypothetical protein SAMN02910323_1433 [Selenomonas ruminantium]|uniref:Uncharacterized protein n=1 Tax=Selenomonas ruminantium TaxID=971 RepID=A0A1K1NJV8_SELRU|nr:hypothetical protein SAMN02910323_1433 [Selenomonas ruminantium]
MSLPVFAEVDILLGINKGISIVLGIVIAVMAVTCVRMVVVEASEKPEVICADEVLVINPGTNQLLMVGNTRKRIQDALSARLVSEEMAGTLPFKVKQASSYEYEGVMTDVDAQVPVALIPLSIISDTLDSSYQVKDKTLYKSVVVGSLYMAICRGGSTANNWTMIGAIPVSGYDPVTLGGDINHPWLVKPSINQKAEVYASMMEKLIREKLNLSQLKPYLKNINKPIADTYEVVDVTMTAKRAPEIFDTQQETVKALIGSIYSARFQEISNKIVYPPITMMGKKINNGDRTNEGNRSVADDVSDSIYSLAGGYSTSGATMTLTVPEPTHKIRLNFSGAGWMELKGKKESLAVKNVGYKAWLRRQIDSQPEKVVDDVKSVQYILPESGSIAAAEKEQLPDIYTELLVRLADRLASQKK